MNYQEWLDKANNAVTMLPQNTIFVLKDLFSGTEWNQLEKGQKLSFGRYFKSAINDGVLANVQYIGKAANNSARYKKV